MQASSTCTFCSKSVLISEDNHNCDQKKIFSFITKAIQPKANPLDNITNLVFQGGGVKGVAYLGALEQLQLERSNILDGVKRIAGTSAGSIMALYLGLNMNVAEIKPLMEQPYSSLLDGGRVLKVSFDQAWYDILKIGADHKHFQAKHIVLKALDYLKAWDEEVKEKPNDLVFNEEKKTELKEAVNMIFKYYGKKMGLIAKAAIFIKGTEYAGYAADWLMKFLHPLPEPGLTELQQIKSYKESIKRTQFPVSNLNSNDLYQEIVKRTTVVTSNDNQYSQTTQYVESQVKSDGSVSFESVSKRFEEFYVKSTTNTRSTIFDDILKSECRGKLSEDDKLELAQVEKPSFIDSNLLSTNVPPQDNLSNYQNSYSTTLDQKSVIPTPEVIGTSDDSHLSNRNDSGSYPNSEMNQKTACLEINENRNLYRDISQQANLQTITHQIEGTMPIGGYTSNVGNYVQVGEHPELSYNVVGDLARKFYYWAIKDKEAIITKEDEGKVQNETPDSQAEEKEILEAKQKCVTKAKEDAAHEYIDADGKILFVAAKEELTWELLPAALGELLWFLILGQQNAAGIQRKLGLFDGSVVKQELIEKPIIDSLRKLNLEPKSDITFKELMDYNSDLPEGKKFKQFYVTAFNTETSKTEVFSAEHTPNVVIADAVRASMSIPVFFNPVTIREKNLSGKPVERSIWKGANKTQVYYMDGGILDNYPIWIFDDLKYCLEEDLKLGSNMKYSIQNPNTLGFRLMDGKTIQKYTNPHFPTRALTEKEIKFQESFPYQMLLTLNAFITEAQENEYLKRGDYTRSVYVNNNGVSPVAFNLTPEQRNGLIKSGKDGVKDYLARANQNFNGEDQRLEFILENDDQPNNTVEEHK